MAHANDHRCDYCGATESNSMSSSKPGDECKKCKQGVLCAKGTKGNP